MSASIRHFAILFAPAMAALADPGAAAGQALQGTASVVDGDTLEIHGTRIRLHGIDAPESAQLCLDRDGRKWRCGQRAALALADRIGRRPVTCERGDVDQYGRVIARCSVGGADLNDWLVREGWAVAYRRFSQEYVAAESDARSAAKGIWAGRFVLPWEWRRGTRLAENRPPATSGGSDCVIKGNISRRGERIYHVPGGQFYTRTGIDEAEGERWFCSEAEARAAGWRPSKR
jgi:endonuclease YncB( thermonuclease family)